MPKIVRAPQSACRGQLALPRPDAQRTQTLLAFPLSPTPLPLSASKKVPGTGRPLLTSTTQRWGARLLATSHPRHETQRIDSAGPTPFGPLLASPEKQSNMTVRMPCADASPLRPLLNEERMPTSCRGIRAPGCELGSGSVMADDCANNGAATPSCHGERKIRPDPRQGQEHSTLQGLAARQSWPTTARTTERPGRRITARASPRP